MKSMHSFIRARALPFALTCALLASCGGAEDLFSQCIDLDGPEFVTQELPVASIGRPYSAVVIVEIVREPFDDDYVYSFYINGKIPDGLTVKSFDGQRKVEIYGTPTTAGVYDIEISVEVKYSDLDDPEDASLCWTEAERTYRLVVGPSSQVFAMTALTPNPSFKRRATGAALGPRSALVHHALRGPSATPASPA
jgi:hypothetical protein